MSCSRDLEKYISFRSLANWKQFNKMIKNTKCSFFNQKIQEIANKARRLQELINWVRKRNFPTVEAIKYNDYPYLEINDLWHALHSTFNIAQDCYVDIKILEEILNKTLKEWPSFLRKEFIKAIVKYNNSSAPRPNKLSWGHLKYIINNEVCLGKIISIANTCFELDFWPSYFKLSIMIVMPKPNKESYDSSKSFQPIVLLNMCYNLKSLELDKKTTLALEKYKRTQQRALYKIVYLIYSYRWSMLPTVHPTLNDHV